MSRRKSRIWPLAVIALAWCFSFYGMAAVSAAAPVGLLAAASMLASGGVLLLAQRLRRRPGVKWNRKSLPPVAAAAAFYALYFVFASYFAVYVGVAELTAVFSLQSLTCLIGFSLVKELYIRQRTILCVGVISIGAVCVAQLSPFGGPSPVWCALLLGLLLCWTLSVILTLDLMEEYPADFLLGWQNLMGGLIALPIAILDPTGFSVPDGTALLLFLAGACIWGMSMPVLFQELQASDTISSGVVFSAVPICCMLAGKIVLEGAGSGVQILGFCLLCVGVALTYFDIRREN